MEYINQINIGSNNYFIERGVYVELTKSGSTCIASKNDFIVENGADIYVRFPDFTSDNPSTLKLKIGNTSTIEKDIYYDDINKIYTNQINSNYVYNLVYDAGYVNQDSSNGRWVLIGRMGYSLNEIANTTNLQLIETTSGDGFLKKDNNGNWILTEEAGFNSITILGKSTSITEPDPKSNSVSITTSSSSELTIGAINKWITIETSSNDEILFGHKLTDIYTGSYGEDTSTAIEYNGTFNVPYLTVDKAGHITDISSTSITLPDETLKVCTSTIDDEYPILAAAISTSAGLNSAIFDDSSIYGVIPGSASGPTINMYDGSLTIPGGIAGDLEIEADLIVGDSTSIVSDLSVGNDLTVTNDLYVSQNLNVTGDIIAGNDVSIDGTTTISEDLIVEGMISGTVSGALYGCADTAITSDATGTIYGLVYYENDVDREDQPIAVFASTEAGDRGQVLIANGTGDTSGDGPPDWYTGLILGGTTADGYTAEFSGSVSVNTRLFVSASNMQTYSSNVLGTYISPGLISVTTSGTITDTGYYLINNTQQYGKLYIDTLGTSSIQGAVYLTLGNGIAVNNTDNARGYLKLYTGGTSFGLYSSNSWSGNGNISTYTMLGQVSTSANENVYSILELGNDGDYTSTTPHSRGILRIYSPGTSYTQIESQTTSSATFYLPKYGTSMYAIHAENNNQLGDKYQGVYIAENGRVTLTYPTQRINWTIANDKHTINIKIPCDSAVEDQELEVVNLVVTSGFSSLRAPLHWYIQSFNETTNNVTTCGHIITLISASNFTITNNQIVSTSVKTTGDVTGYIVISRNKLLINSTDYTTTSA